ncbi:Peptidyl-prolyl isomerase cwc27 [Coemansia sp. RSA 1200]|nr:Peptidyl-prolyl isomerase cwc27 [Coemansia sp. RSA 1200]
MSNIYVSEPPTSGKVVLETTVGSIEIELWSKETPKTCRNFVQLCMEGYFDGTIFHRVVPGWIAQGGDPSGTGEGGESIYGAPFADEFHSRLRFNRRGLVGMANSGPNDNRSQFFITLASTPELQKKNTLFATVVGDSVFNALKLGEGEVDKESERPTYPRKVIHTRVLDNPFTDIIIRGAPEICKEKCDSVAIRKPSTRNPKIKSVRNKKLLSFADDENDGDVVVATSKGSSMKSSHDLLAADPALGKGILDGSVSKSKSKDDNVIYSSAETNNSEAVVSEPKEIEKKQVTPQSAQQDQETAYAGSVDLMRAQYGSKGSAARKLKGRKSDLHEDELLSRLGAFKSKIRKVVEDQKKQ